MAGSVLDNLRDLPPETFASKHIFEAIPHVFKGDLDLYIAWKAELAGQIEVDPRAMAITGSAGLGISLSPHKGFAAFGANSDVDIAVVSAHHFEIAWRHLRFLPAKTRMRLKPRQQESLKDHRQRLIYWGAIATDRILELLPFATEWVVALGNMAGIEPTLGREINARIYRDFDSLRSYQLLSVRNARANLLSTSEGEV